MCKAIMLSIRLYYFYLTYKCIKTIEVRKQFPKDFAGRIYEYVSKTNWKKDLMRIPESEREFFKQFVGKVGLCFECDKVEEITQVWHISSFTNEKVISCYRGLKNGITNRQLEENSCLTHKELKNYIGWDKGYAIHISQLEIFDKPKYIDEFKARYYPQFAGMVKNETHYELRQLTKAPQNYMFIEVEE